MAPSDASPVVGERKNSVPSHGGTGEEITLNLYKGANSIGEGMPS